MSPSPTFACIRSQAVGTYFLVWSVYDDGAQTGCGRSPSWTKDPGAIIPAPEFLMLLCSYYCRLGVQSKWFQNWTRKSCLGCIPYRYDWLTECSHYSCHGSLLNSNIAQVLNYHNKQVSVEWFEYDLYNITDIGLVQF